MTILTLPPKLPVKHQDFGFMTYDLSFTSEDTGSGQVAVNGPVRRTCAMLSEEQIPLLAEAAMWRALSQGMGGQVNRLAVHDLLNPVPRGTARGVWTSRGAARGATAMVIAMGADQAGKTLLTGDWVGVHQTSVHRQLLHVQSDAIADAAGLITIEFAFALRTSVPVGSAVVWDRPTCLMARTDTKNTWASESRTQGGFSLDLIERWGA